MITGHDNDVSVASVIQLLIMGTSPVCSVRVGIAVNLDGPFRGYI